MDMSFAAEEEAFRNEVTAFCETLPIDMLERVKRNDHLAREDNVAYQKALFDKGWSVPTWPKEWGGAEWTPVMQNIFDEVTARYGCPRKVPFGETMVGPVIQKFGSEAQKQYYLPRIARFDDWWCQGFSEPNSGSDLASLTTSAIRDGDYYILNGQKTWTTYAQHADWIFNLVRTDADVKPQEGISFLLVDMKSPGVTVQPIHLIDDYREVNSIFFDNVKVPVENLVGEENMGWTYAKYLLAHERNNIAQTGYAKQQISLLKSIAKEQGPPGHKLADDPSFQRKLAEIEIDVKTLEIGNFRMLADTKRKTDLTAAAMLKIRASEINQAISKLIMEAVGPAAAPDQTQARARGWNEPVLGPDYSVSAAPHYFNLRKMSIYGGSNEVQHAIIAKAMLSQ